MKGPGGIEPIIEESDPTTSGGSMITKDCKDTALAIKFLDYILATEDGANLANYGVEGLSYTMVDGKPQFTDFVTNNPDKLAPQDAVRSIGSLWSMPYQETAILRDITASDTVKEFNNKLKNDFKWVAYFPAHRLPMTKEETDEYWKLYESVYTYKDEMTDKFIMGKESFDKWQEYVDKIKSFKLDKVTELEQAGADRFFKASAD